MLFMLVASFRDHDPVPAYERMRESGRGMPDGVDHLGGWVDAGFGRSFQLVRCGDLRLLQLWVLHWRGSGITVEAVPVLSMHDARESLAPPAA